MLSETALHRIVGATVLLGIGAIVLPILFSNVRVEYSNQLGERETATALASATPQPEQTPEHAVAQTAAATDLDNAAMAVVKTTEMAAQIANQTVSDAAVYTESKPVMQPATAANAQAPQDSLAMQQPAADARIATNDKPATTSSNPATITEAADTAAKPGTARVAATDKALAPVQPVLLAALDPVVAASVPSHNHHVAYGSKSKIKHVTKDHGATKSARSKVNMQYASVIKSKHKKKAPRPHVVPVVAAKLAAPAAIAAHKPTQVAAATTGQHFAVQLGLFAERQHAKKLTADLRSQGFKVKPLLVMSNGKVLTKVVLSPVSSYAQAKQQLNNLRTKTNMAGIIVSV